MLRITSVYLRHTNCPLYRSVLLDRVFSPPLHLHLVLGDFNMHYPLVDPLWSLTHKEYSLSATYFDAAFEAPYHLLNTPGVYTRFLFDTISSPSVLDLAFANSPLSPFISLWDTPLPSTGSDHVPITITLMPPAVMLPYPTPYWALLDWSSVRNDLLNFSFTPSPSHMTSNALARWFDVSSTRLTTLLVSHAPAKSPSPHSKPWWSQHLSSLRREYHVMSKKFRQDPSLVNWGNMKSTRRSYFKAIAMAKRAIWSDFLFSATPHSVWMPKRFAFSRPPQRSQASLRPATLPRWRTLFCPTSSSQDPLLPLT